ALSQNPSPAKTTTPEQALAALQKQSASFAYSVKIEDPKFGDAQLKDAIPNIKALVNVQELDFSKTSITPAGALMLKELKGLKGLRTLQVPDSVVNTPQTKELANTLGIGIGGAWHFVGSRLQPLKK